jgi:excisionase family DNA binding protein
MSSIPVIVSADTRRPLPDGMVDTVAAAQYLGVSRATVSRWAASGRIHGAKQVRSRGREGWQFMVPTKEIMRVRKERDRDAREQAS